MKNIKFEMMKNSTSAKVVLGEESEYIIDIVDLILSQIKNIFRCANWIDLTQEEQTRFLSHNITEWKCSNYVIAPPHCSHILLVLSSNIVTWISKEIFTQW